MDRNTCGGGTASRQRGFLGCIRALNVNGVNFDLDERAKMTPGVSSGCPGHCSSSAGFCHNRGKCIEKSSGYVCDCTHSAYGGPSCKEEVSVSFEKGSSVTYTFQEPFSFMQNKTAQVSSASSAYSKSRDNMALSFLTTQSPAMLLTVNTYTQQYVAVILARNGVLSGGGQDSVQAVPVPPHQTRSPMSLWSLLCALVCGHVGTGGGRPQTVPTKLGAWNGPESLGLLKH
ncbi:hypothetical protein NFI96_008364 [Prochilodus magdalenae]|nr:hypothetical protein NFI96_008364 [Prochilodus magdalenae]